MKLFVKTLKDEAKGWYNDLLREELELCLLLHKPSKMNGVRKMHIFLMKIVQKIEINLRSSRE
jgi:hypothetical protein